MHKFGRRDGFHYASIELFTISFYFDRTFGGHRDHCHSGRDVTAGVDQSEVEGSTDAVPEQYEAVAALLADVC